MVPIVLLLAVFSALLAGHLRVRRHPGWFASADGRFFIGIGYPLIAIAIYWLTVAPTSTTWEWAVGNAWALAAMVCFVYGFDALNAAKAAHATRARPFESIEPTPTSEPPRP